MPFWAAANAFAKTPLGGKVVSGILGGLSSLFGGKSKRKAAEQEQKYKLEQIKQEAKAVGDETRKTSLYEAQLASAADEYGRARKRGAFQNFGFAAENDPYASTMMQGYEQKWKPSDTKLVLPNVPGATPTASVPPVSAVPRR